MITDWKSGDIAEIKEGWDGAGTRVVLLWPAVKYKDQWWVPIIHPDDEDPTFFKGEGLRKVS